MAEETRCPCGDNDDQEGFMIQCEVCSVWQHGECVGVLEETVPEEYYCELCMPEHEIHQNRRKLLAIMKASKKGHRKGPRNKDKGKDKGGRDRRRGYVYVPENENNDTLKRKRAEPPPSPQYTGNTGNTGNTGKPMSREERKLKQILETIAKLEGGGDTRRAGVPSSPRPKSLSPRASPRATPKHSPRPSPRASPKPSPKASPKGSPRYATPKPAAKGADGAKSALRSGRMRSTNTPTPRPSKRKRAASTYKSRKESKSTLNTSRAARTTGKQPISRFPRRALLPLAPMYLGKKRWLASTVESEQRAHDKLSGGNEGLRAHLTSCALPMARRLLGAYAADRALVGAGQNLI